MTKRAVILHGTDGIPGELRWEVWLKQQLEDSGYEVFYPQLPDCHTPNLATYDAFLQESGWDFTDNVVIGHSSGATTLLHLLGWDWFPKLKAAVLVGTFLNESKIKSESWYEPGQFDDLLVEEFDPAVIPEGAEKLYFVHGDDDPFCDYDLAREFCKQVGGTFVSVPGGGHIGVDADIAELPLLRNVLVLDGALAGEVEGGTREPIVWVDEENNVLGPIERGYAKKSGERYRMTRVIIEDERGNTLIQKRTMTKDSYPGCWDNSTAGHVTWGESYEDAVRREIGEELGLPNAEPKQLFSYYSEVVDPIGAVLNEWGMVYHVKIAHDTEFAMQEEELSGLRWVTPEELGEIVAEGEVTEGLRQIYQRYFEKKRENMSL